MRVIAHSATLSSFYEFLLFLILPAPSTRAPLSSALHFIVSFATICQFHDLQYISTDTILLLCS